MIERTCCAGLVWLAASGMMVLPGPALADLPRLALSASFYRIEAEVAANDASRQQGLMRRPQLPVQQGMLFVFPQAAQHCMWMKNTLIPLSVAFMDRDGRILNIEDMQPHSEDNHCAVTPAAYALEMNRGWFAQKGIRPGMKISGLDKAPRPN